MIILFLDFLFVHNFPARWLLVKMDCKHQSLSSRALMSKI